MSKESDLSKVIKAAVAGNAAWEAAHFGEAQKSDYISSLGTVGEGLSNFVQDDQLREFLDMVLDFEIQGAAAMVIERQQIH